MNTIAITGSKSETNRLLLLQALFPNIKLENTSNSDDSTIMYNALLQQDNIIKELDIHHAGTTMRFLTAFYAAQEGKEIILTGSLRMKERPIKILVDALRQLGSKITYLENEGFPPIKIKGTKIMAHQIELPANVSSQYISALLLIAPKLNNGLELNLVGKITSIPYINMTLELLNKLSIKTIFKNNKIVVFPTREIPDIILQIESDWSSASYFYSFVALSESLTVRLTTYKKQSLQGDSKLSDIYKLLGVETQYEDNSILLTRNKEKLQKDETLSLSLENTPDIAQTIAVTCFGLGIACHLTGLHTLKIKETDRLEALKIELTKLGAIISVTKDSLFLKSNKTPHTIPSNVTISTYNDHRMAMSFAPLSLKVPIIIENPEVVSKSYPDFWKDIEYLKFEHPDKKKVKVIRLSNIIKIETETFS